MQKPYRIALILFALSVLIAVGLFIVTTIPQPSVLNETVGDATIHFELPNSQIFDDNSCYQVRWKVDGIKGVFLNGEGVVGEDAKDFCYQDVKEAKLRVIFQDETEKTYTLELTIIQQQPYFWLALGTAGLLLFFSLYFAIAPSIGITLETRRSTIIAIGNLIVITVLSLAVVCGGLEFLLRFYFSNYGTEVERIGYVYSREEIQEQVTQFTGVPYTLFVPNPNYEGHNSLGYRGEEFSLKKSEGTFRIVSVGESTTYGFGVNANQAYPALLQEILRDDYGYDHIEVINAGVVGYTSFEMLTNFQFRVLELEPDLVIYYGALNDADTRLEDPGCFNSPSPLYGITTIRGLWRTEYADLPASTLYRYFAVNIGIMNVPSSIEFALAEIPIAKECKSDQKYTEEQKIALNDTRFVARNFRNFLAIAQYYGIDIMVSEFVHPSTLEQVGGDEKLLMTPAREQAVDEVDSIYRGIAEDMNIHYYPMADDFVIEPGMFWTVVHMRAEGTEQQARLYAKYLVDNNLIPKN